MTWLVLMNRPRENGPPAQDELDYQPGDVVCLHEDAQVAAFSGEFFSDAMRTNFFVFHSSVPMADCMALLTADVITEAGVVKELKRRWRLNLDVLEHKATGAWKSAIAKARNPSPPPTSAQMPRNVAALTVEESLEDCRDGLGVTWVEARAHAANVPVGPDGFTDEGDRVPVVHNRALVMRGGKDRHEHVGGKWKVKAAKRGPHHVASGA